MNKRIAHSIALPNKMMDPEKTKLVNYLNKSIQIIFFNQKK